MRTSLHLAALTAALCQQHGDGFAFSGGSFAAKRAGQRLSVESCSTTSTSQGRRRTIPGEVRMMSGSLEDEVEFKGSRLEMKPTPELGSSKNKMLHVVYRVGNMDRAIKFYQDVFGMELLRYRDVAEDKYSNAFLGYGTESKGEHFSIELTYNYGVESYNIGDGFNCMGLRLPDLEGIVARAKAGGGEIVSGPEEVKLGPCIIPDEPVGKHVLEQVAVIKDPDGYTFEVSESAYRRDPVSKVSLLTLDMEKSIDFYQDALGMTLLRRRSLLPQKTQQACWMGYGAEDDSTVLELVYEYNSEKIDRGDGYGQIAVSTPDVFDAAAAVEKTKYDVTRAPGPVPGIGTKITAVTDPDGFKTVLVDEVDIEKELEEESA
ncbi:conserved unknown protein [Ectocarpus siliculosus]|uniref:VOC domain-containing protein n=1 Tax=Ectocarpus siliculosus TaxID=2880 RepID=D7FRI2_ECTSI|nr:conserved unknown protein [Ectocarpus siliculosus]|eukprot:CBJ30773.1 conserved unknown protein [Ectocarpus siliculosus]